MAYSKNTDVTQTAKDLLIAQYQDQTNWDKLFDIIGARFQTVENVIYDLYTKRFIDTAEGVQLDKIGELVGAPEREPGQSDSDYRQVIYATIAANSSQGLHNQVIEFLQLIQAEGIRLVNKYPAGLNIMYTGAGVLISYDNILETLIKITTEIEIDLTRYESGYFGFLQDSQAAGYNVGVYAGDRT